MLGHTGRGGVGGGGGVPETWKDLRIQTFVLLLFILEELMKQYAID